MSKYVGALTTFLLFVVVAIAIYGAWRSGPPAPELSLKILSYNDIPSWDEESQPWDGALAAFERSCRSVLRRPGDAPFARRAVAPDIRRLYGEVSDWQAVCRMASDDPGQSAKAFFERYFDPVMISENQEKTGLFTGYYEPVLKGSRTQEGPFQTPLLARPDDLVMVELGDFRDTLAGQRIAGRVIDGKLWPFESRAEIETTADWVDPLVIVWVEDAIEAFFLHIQGSGRIELPDGQTIRVNYSGQNGHPYTAIGRVLIDMGELEREEVSLQTIQSWLKANSEQADDVMRANASYIFFREIAVEDPELGPPGAQGVVLTPLSSIAVDRLYYPMGTPVWLDIDLNGQILTPSKTESSLDPVPFHALSIAQDTGGAIKGAQRADLFWGSGEDARAASGLMKESGTMYALIPKSLTSAYLESREDSGS